MRVLRRKKNSYRCRFMSSSNHRQTRSKHFSNSFSAPEWLRRKACIAGPCPSIRTTSYSSSSSNNSRCKNLRESYQLSNSNRCSRWPLRLSKAYRAALMSHQIEESKTRLSRPMNLRQIGAILSCRITVLWPQKRQIRASMKVKSSEVGTPSPALLNWT